MARAASRIQDLSALVSLLSRGSQSEITASLAQIQIQLRKRLSSPARAIEPWLRELGHVLAQAQGDHAVLQRVEILISLAMWFEDNFDRPFAIKLLEKALYAADHAGAFSLKRRVLNTLGAIHNRDKNITAAMISYAEALKIADQIGDKFGRCAVISNMAALRFTMGMIDDSIKLLHFLLEAYGEESIFRVLRAHAHHNLAISYLVLSDLTAAHKHVRLAVENAQEPTTHEELSTRVVMELTFVKVLVALGQIEKARSRAEIAVSYSSRADTNNAKIQSQLAIALCEAAEGKTDIALTRLTALEPGVSANHASFRDFIEIQLFANEQAGRKRQAGYYTKKYLFSLAEYQRKVAIEQVAGVKRLLKQTEISERAHRAPHGKYNREIVGVFGQHVEALAALAELREDANGGHSYRVGVLSRLLALTIGHTTEDALIIERAARLHDIGKLATPDAILLKRGRLTAAETEVIRRHPVEGCQILADLLYTVEATELHYGREIANNLRVAAEVSQHHHEWWNGSGYPRGIAGTMIPEAARIVAIADVFDELTHSRPYRKQCSKVDSVRQLEKLSGSQFDPRLCAAFIDVIQCLKALPSQPESDATPFELANRVIGRLVTVA